MTIDTNIDRTETPDPWAGLGAPNGDQEAIGYELRDQYIGEKRRVRVITIGGGASGINMAYQIDKWMTGVEHVVYEKSAELGGTWLDNRYPGCACDVPSHDYQFSFHPNPNWSHFYSGSPEICDYMNSVVEKYNLHNHFKCGHEVTSARWDDDAAQWVVGIKGPNGEFEDRADFLVNGSGILNNWRWPDIPGIQKFKGKLMHTARWDQEYDFKGKRVACIGVGSSAVQTVPALVPIVDSMTCFIRSGAWITPVGAAPQYAGPGGSNKAYTEEEKKRWAENPDEFLAYRKDIEDALNSRFRMYLKDTKEQEAAVKVARAHMAARLVKKPELVELLTPKFSLGCRRLTPGNGFLESLCEDHVSVISNPIERITENGLITKDGKVHEVDAIVCATGFDVSLLPRFPFTGKNGADLKERWNNSPVEGYMSLMVDEFPNYFMFLGPSAPVAHGSLTQTIEWCSHYMLKCISKMQAEGIRSISPKKEVVRRFNIHRNAMMPTTAWSSTCSSWYKNGKADGPVIAIHPGSKLHFFDMTKTPRFEDMDIEYDHENMFAYLGSGFSKLEIEPGHDMSYFITDPSLTLPW
ncbi:hypothetical protein CspHIS471_0108370 [Cutaneotrichosporon sp. HIS471]|nr:hypothetical protein CspHIS471_0108370 [Cutaneotrichosporon sp. HIS471]